MNATKTWVVLSIVALTCVGCGPSAEPEEAAEPEAAVPEATEAAPTSDAGDADVLAGEWLLVALGDETELAGPITMTVDPAEGKISGRATCNNYFSPWMAEGGEVETGLTGSTMMACPEPAMDQEAAYFAALEAATGYRLEGDTLELTGEDGEVVLRFARPESE